MVLSQFYRTRNIRPLSFHSFGVVVSVSFRLIGVVARKVAIAYGGCFMRLSFLKLPDHTLTSMKSVTVAFITIKGASL